jgi:hypothetical protein
LLATVGGLAVEGARATAPAQTEEIAADELEEMAGATIDFDARRGVTVKGVLGGTIKTNKIYNIQEVESLWKEGVGVPLDLMPLEYWHRAAAVHDPGLYNGSDHSILPFSEEALGADF